MATKQKEEEDMLMIGGIKGHVEEEISGDLLQLWQHREWKPIPNCTGRYTCREKKTDTIRPTQLTPMELIRQSTNIDNDKPYWRVQEFGPASGRNDRILVLPLDETKATGIISYVKESNTEDGTKQTKYIHTLNAPSGFQRKLEAVGIQLEE